MTALSDLPYSVYAANRDAARAKRRGSELFPRLLVLNGAWVRQDADGSFNVVSTVDAVKLLDLDEAAA